MLGIMILALGGGAALVVLAAAKGPVERAQHPGQAVAGAWGLAIGAALAVMYVVGEHLPV